MTCNFDYLRPSPMGLSIEISKYDPVDSPSRQTMSSGHRSPSTTQTPLMLSIVYNVSVHADSKCLHAGLIGLRYRRRRVVLRRPLLHSFPALAIIVPAAHLQINTSLPRAFLRRLSVLQKKHVFPHCFAISTRRPRPTLAAPTGAGTTPPAQRHVPTGSYLIIPIGGFVRGRRKVRK